MDTPARGLQTFTLNELNQYTREGDAIPAGADHWVFYVGRDNVHGVLAELLGRISLSLYLNMFGYDDDQLNDLCMAAAADPHVACLITLDKSQSGSVHERRILQSDIAADATTFNSHFVIGTSASSQISHTKGGVLDGVVGFEGSTNWSTSGEGTYAIQAKQAGGPGYKAQNNTLCVFTDPQTTSRFSAELVSEHAAASRHGKILEAGTG